MDYDELFSCFGTRALDVIFNMDASKLPEHDINMLILLVNRMQRDDRLVEEVSALLSGKDDKQKLGILLSIAALK